MADMDFVKIFIIEAQESLEVWEGTSLRYESGANETEDLNTLFRIAHNLKGSALSVGLAALGDALHRIEEILTALKNGSLHRSEAIVTLLLDAQAFLSSWVEHLSSQPEHVPTIRDSFAARIEEVLKKSGIKAAVQTRPKDDDDGISFLVSSDTVSETITETEVAQTIPAKAPTPVSTPAVANKTIENTFLRVALPRLDDLLNLIGELVVDQAIMQKHRSSHTTESQQALRTISHMGKTIQEVQSIAMSLRMTPLDASFQKLQRTARTVASQLGKQVEVVLEGGEVELDKVIVDRLSEPLVHMVRNAVDHGTESPDIRKAAGKPEQAVLRIKASQREDQVIIIIEDDGAGLDPEKLVQLGIKRGVVPAGAKLKNEEAYALIFEPGFSTKKEVSAISGRGVGMDVVATAIRDLKGVIDVKSTLGKGTTFTLTLPLSLSIIQGLVVGVDNEKYVIPLTQLVETIDTLKVPFETVRGKGRVLNIRGEVVPFLSIGEILGLPQAKSAKEGRTLGVISSCRGRKMAFSVSSILGQQSVVLKTLSRVCEGVPGIIGGAILGDGEPALVLNLNEISNTWSVKNAAV